MKKIVIILLIIFSYKLYSDTLDAEISVDTKHPLPCKITPLLFGSFIEFIKNYMSGPFGMTAQELVDRGFDMDDKDGFGIAYPWKPLKIDNADGSWKLIHGGYNINGRYLQKITRKNNKGTLGIYQHIFLTDSTANNFYIYIRGDSGIKSVSLTLYDSSFQKKYYNYSFGKPDTSWCKEFITVPFLTNITNAMLAITIEGIGNIEIDESSFLPKNNVLGIRKEFFKFFKELKPGIIRYPGGCFADWIASHLEYGIGNLDQRKSPNLCFEGISQRLDFGIDEFVAFCRLIGAEPHITVNFENGTPEEAAAWVEYCNGSPESHYGALRAANGHIEPYNVKYWEVGNEQYKDSENMARRYLLYYKAMKDEDSSIVIMVDGNIWAGFDYFNTVLGIVKDSTQIYGWHWSDEPYRTNDEMIYHLMFMSRPYESLNNTTDDVLQWLKNAGIYPNVKQGITEWMSKLQNGWTWQDDTRAWTIETAIVEALTYQSFIRHSESLLLAERTAFVESGILISRYDSVKNRRQVFVGAPYYTATLYCNHTGTELLPSLVYCSTYDIPEDKVQWSPKNVPWLDVVATRTQDTLFLSVVNRNPNDSIRTKIFIDNFIGSVRSKIYELSDTNYLTMNSPSVPFNVAPKIKDIVFKQEYIFPVNSLTIFAIPLKELIVNPGMDSSSKVFVDAYPNPFNDFLELDFNKDFVEPVYCTIYDQLGRKIEDFTIDNPISFYSINTESLPEGAYILKIKTGKSIYNKLIIKTK